MSCPGRILYYYTGYSIITDLGRLPECLVQAGGPHRGGPVGCGRGGGASLGSRDRTGKIKIV